MADLNAEFWNRQSVAFTAADGQRRSYHAEFASILNAGLGGDVLCVGGLFQNADVARLPRLSVVDVSQKMLDVWASRGVRGQLGDARQLPIASASVDHVVFPLVLHHITDGDAEASRANVLTCLREAYRVLRPGGTVWAIEILVSEAVYALERAFAPVTRRLLATRNIPLVMFHPRRFYLDQLAAAGLSNASLTYTTAEHDPWHRLVRPVIGLGLLVPRVLVPVKYGLLRATKRF